MAQSDLDEATIQASKVKEAAFCSWTLLMPKPPSLVGRQITSYLISFLFKLLRAADHRKLHMKLSIIQEADFGRGKIKAMCVARLLKTCLTRTLRPAKERSLDFHPESLEWNLSSG